MKPRKLLNKILSYLPFKEILVIFGARQVGKTSLLKLIIDELKKKNIHENDIFYFDLEDIFILEMFNSGVKEVVNYITSKSVNSDTRKFIFIDEIQYLKNPSNFLKLFYDHYSEKFKIICTGSSSFEIRKKFTDSLVGRYFSFELSGLDFEEFLWFKDISYKFSSSNIQIINELKELFKEYVIYGQYPRIALIKNEEVKRHYLLEILDAYLRKDIREIANFRDVMKFNQVLKMLASYEGLLNLNELSKSLRITRKTLEKVIFILENTYIISLIYPFHKNFKKELIKMPKIYFEDTGLKNLLANQFFLKKVEGNLFETAVFGCLKKRFGKNSIRYWRTKDKKEIDFIVLKNDKIAGFEVKTKFTGKIPSSIRSFQSNYNNSEIKIITLEKIKKSDNVIYPWELYIFNEKFN